MSVHEAKDFPGATVASLAIPWGYARGDGDMGYHLVWARDMIETVGGLLAVRKHEDARRVLFYLDTTQEADGHWPQNMFLDGRPCWGGVQLDETAFVILLVGMARGEKALNDADLRFLWPMVRRAAGFLVRHGPVTPMDRWEEVPGYYASTLAVEIPALLVAAEVAESQGEPALAGYLRETADAWKDAIDRLLYARHRACPPGRHRGLLRPPGPPGPDAGRHPGLRHDHPAEPPARPGGTSGRRGRQPRRADAGPLRPARRRRPAHCEHREGDRPVLQGRAAGRPLLAPLHRRRLWGSRRRHAVRRHRHRRCPRRRVGLVWGVRPSQVGTTDAGGRPGPRGGLGCPRTQRR
jgi:hypothetical protein